MKKIVAILTLITAILCFPACKKGGETLSVYLPDGAPALAFSLAINEADGDYNVVGADVITAKVTGENPLADVAVVPINVASLYLGSGDTYKMLGTLTHGNFYFLSKSGVNISRENAQSLIGKTVGVVQLANVPGLTLKVALSNLNIEYNELKNGATAVHDKVNLLAIKPTEIGVQGCDYYMAPSPVADAKSKALGLSFNGSLSELYGEKGFPQAVVVAKNSVISDNFEELKAVINKVQGCNEYLSVENKNAITSAINGCIESGLTPQYNDKNLTENSIARANISFVLARENKAEVIDFINQLKSVNANAVGTLSDEFFYMGEF